jgi:hypothetical protein
MHWRKAPRTANGNIFYIVVLLLFRGSEIGVEPAARIGFQRIYWNLRFMDKAALCAS